MAEPAWEEEPLRPDVSHLITEDDEPVDNWFQERQQRLLCDSLSASWECERPFVVAANVGLFHQISQQAVVPDVMLSLDVTLPEDYWEKHHRSYMIWEFGKAPDLVVEVVSNRKGDEDGKLLRFAHAGVPYYAIYDPRGVLSRRPLRLYALYAGRYVDVLESAWLEDLGLGLVLWEGTFEGMSGNWLRWCDRNRKVLPTGLERAEQERRRAEQERERADRLADRLRELGFDPEEGQGPF